MKNSTSVPPLVSTKWVQENVGKIIPLHTNLMAKNTDPRLSFLRMHLKDAREFDIDKIADTSSVLPHMVPSEADFEQHMRDLKISNTDHLVIYDTVGIYSACRVFWMLKYFGHEKVSVMDGGLPKWLAEKRKVFDNKAIEALDVEEYKVEAVKKELVSNYENVLDIAKNKQFGQSQLFDARPYLRFIGKEDEPRPNTPRGNIPNSQNLPFTDFLKFKEIQQTPVMCFKDGNEIRNLIKEKGIKRDVDIISSCGSGITACIVYFGLIYASNFEIDSSVPLNNSDYQKWKISVYDGSWAEYSTRGNSPIIKS